MTPEQITTLHNFVFASTVPAIVAARTAGNTCDLMNLLNANASPVVKAWRPDAPAVDLDDAADYTTFDTMGQGKRDEWNIFLRYPRDMTKGPKRKVVTDVWGNATAGSVAESVLNASIENSTLAQATIGGGNANTGTVTALKRDFNDRVTQEDCQKILAGA